MTTSLFTEIVSGLHKNAPDASPEDLTNILIKVIEKDILPAAIKNMKLPRPPSPLEIKREQLYLKRMPKRFRNLSTTLKEKLIREFDYIKHQLNGRETDNPSFVPDFFVTDFDTLRIPVDLTFKSSIQVTSPKKDGLSRESILEELTVSPYIKSVKEKDKEFPKFIITEEIQNKIASDLLLREIFRIIEIKIKDFVTTFPSRIDLTVALHKDLELPEWEKTVITISAINFDFDRKMILWEILDSKVRSSLKEMMDHASPSERPKIEDFNRNLFTHMELE